MNLNKKEIILPVEKPWITTYPIFANPLSILQLYEKSHPWILNSFIQLVCNGGEALSFYDFNYRTCPFLTVQKIKKSTINNINSNIIDFFKILLQDQQYIYLIINPKHINVYNQKYDGRHDIFIYGYSDSKSVFYIADNFLMGKYSYGECTYDELVKSILFLKNIYEGYLGFNSCIECISYNDDENYNKYYYDVNIIRLRDSLKAYLEGKVIEMWSTQEFRVARYGEKSFEFGVNCYQFIHKTIEQISFNSQNHIPIPSFYIIYDHKKHLLRIIQYLNKHNIINGNIYIKKLEEICNLALNCVNLAVKYSLNKNIKLLDKLHLYYSEIQSLEESIVSEIIISLNKALKAV